MSGWGGARAGAGRPKGWRKENPVVRRPIHSLSAFDDEWEVIKDFMKFVREVGADKAKKYLAEMK